MWQLVIIAIKISHVHIVQTYQITCIAEVGSGTEKITNRATCPTVTAVFAV